MNPPKVKGMGNEIPVVDSLPRQQKKAAPRGTGILQSQPQPPSPVIDLQALAGAWHVLFPTKPTPHWPSSQPAAPAFTVDHSQPPAPRAVMPINSNLKRIRATSPSPSKAIPAPKRRRGAGRRFEADIAKVQAAIIQAVMAKNSPPSNDPVDFEDIKAWIAEQEASPTPAPLTELQRRAITDLKNSIKASAEPKFEDLLGDIDWVSLLLRYRDARPELGVSVEFHVVANGPPWGIHCTIQSSRRDQNGQPMNREFPDQDFGFVAISPGGAVCDPTFQRKKDAKRYAAKCCVDFLMKEGHMPTDGVNVTFPKPNLKIPTPPAKKRKVVSQSIGTSSVNRPITNASSSSSNISTPSNASQTQPHAVGDVTQAAIAQPTTVQAAEAVGGGSPVDVYDEDISATSRVEEMCRRLRIQPPRYKEQPGPVDDTHYNALVEFGIDMQLPDTVGRVVNCRNKSFAREKVAEEVLEYLFQVEAKRNAAADALLQAMTSREVEIEL